MRWNIVGAFIRNNPFGTEIAFRKGLERIGETVTVVDPGYPDQKFDEAPDVTLVFKWVDPGPYRDKIVSLPGKKVIYQVDDLRFPHIKQMMLEMRSVCNNALTFDQDGANLALEYGYDSGQSLLLTADNLLYRHIPGMQKDIDVSFVGSLSNGPNHASRMRMIQLVKGIPGLRVVIASELFDIGKLCEIYNRSKVVLNHATDVGQPFGHGYGYQCRHFEAGFTKTCILSNAIDNDKTLEGHFATFRTEDELVKNLQSLLDPSPLNFYREYFATSLYNELNRRHLPEHRAREMVQFVRSIQ